MLMDSFFIVKWFSLDITPATINETLQWCKLHLRLKCYAHYKSHLYFLNLDFCKTFVIFTWSGDNFPVTRSVLNLSTGFPNLKFSPDSSIFTVLSCSDSLIRPPKLGKNVWNEPWLESANQKLFKIFPKVVFNFFVLQKKHEKIWNLISD